MQKDNAEKSTAIKVYVRVRPLIGPEIGSNEVVSVDEDVEIGLRREKPSKYQPTLFPLSKPSSTRLFPKKQVNETFSTTFAISFPKYLKVTI